MELRRFRENKIFYGKNPEFNFLMIQYLHERNKAQKYKTKGEIFIKINAIETKVKLLSIRQAAKVVDGLTEYRIRKLCYSGELPCLIVGRKRLVNEKTLIDFVVKSENTKGAKSDVRESQRQ
jgi:hypothetical protein